MTDLKELQDQLLKANVRFELYKELAAAETKKAETERDILRKAIKEIQANHATPHRQRTGCRLTTEICNEALFQLEPEEESE